MATLQKIIVSNFRNIEFAEISFSGSFNCICGDNGQGKTNLLDAIHFLSMTKSAFGIPDRLCIRHGMESFTLAGTYLLDNGCEEKIILSAGAEGKILKRGDKQYDRIGDHIGLIPVVAVSPADVALVSEGGEQRRRFANAVLSQIYPEYLRALQKYVRILQQRNRLLKDFRPDMMLLDSLDAQLCETVPVIFRKRSEFASSLGDAVTGYYGSLSGGGEEVGLEYRSDLCPEGDSAGNAGGDGRVMSGMAGLLRESRDRDMYLKYTSVGLQRDDFLFTMSGHPIRRCGSQGQQKSFLVALKLAQYALMRRLCGTAPILLLDDVFDKLDSSRMANLLKIVGERDYGQIFITDTSAERMKDVISGISSDAAYFKADNGRF